MSFYQHNCREIRRVFVGKNMLENIGTLFGNIRALLHSHRPNNEIETIKQIDEVRVSFENKKMKKVSVILKQLHLRNSYCSFHLLDDKNKQFIQKIFGRNHYWDFLVVGIVGDLPQSLFNDENEYNIYRDLFKVLHA